jgi:hypothetical protein
MEQPALQRGYFREWIRCGIQQECEIVVNFDPEPDPGGSKDEHPVPLDTIPSPDGGISHDSYVHADVDGKAPVTISGRDSPAVSFDGLGQVGFAPRCLNSCQQTYQKTGPMCAALPDSARNDAGEVAFYHNIRQTSSGGYDHQRDDRVAYLSRECGGTPSGSPENLDPKMPVVAIFPHPRYGGEPFEKEVEFEPDIERAMVSEDLIGLFGSMEMVSPSLAASVNGQNVKCTGLVDFSMGYVDRSCSVAAWVTPDLQDSIVIGSQTSWTWGS